MFKTLLALMVALATLFTVLPATTQAQDSSERPYSLYIPTSYDASQPAPLVMVLHAFGSSGLAIEHMTDFDTYAEENGSIVVYPNSISALNWNDGRESFPGIEKADDSAYLLGLLDELSAEYTIDATQVYLVGYATGGVMAFRLACEAPERFAKVVTVNASMWSYQLDAGICNTDGAPVEILSILGTRDTYNLPSGRTIPTDPPIHTLTAPEMGAFWAERNGCDPTNAEVIGMATVYCAASTPYTTYLLEGTGHFWARMGDYHLNQHGIDFTQTVWDFIAGASIDFTRTINKEVNEGAPRNYIVYTPPGYDASTPMPVVMALHGRPDTAYGMAFLSDMNSVAQTNNFIMVYPDGVQNEWNFRSGVGGLPQAGVDDVQFLKDIVDDLAQDFNIDRSRVYVMGFSNGGFMTQRVACEAGDTFAGFAVISAILQVGIDDLCVGKPAAPIIFFHGTDDNSIPWDGITDGRNVMAYSVTDTITFWALHNECKPEESGGEDLPGESTETSITYFHFGGCANNSAVDFYAVTGGGHSIPGVAERMPADTFGVTTTNIYAPQLIWDFFSQHSLE